MFNIIKKFFTFTAILLVSSSVAFAQNQATGTLRVTDSLNPTAINANAILEMKSGNKGLLLPRLALTATNAATPLGAFVAGMTVYNTASAGTVPNNVTPGYYYSDGTQWIRLVDAAWLLTGNAGTTAGTHFLGTTDDVDLIFKRKNVQAGWLNNTLTSTAFGVGSLPAATSTGQGNTAIGYSSLTANTSGYNNVAIGYNALTANTSGYANVAIGYNTMKSFTGGTNGIIAIGSAALSAITTPGLSMVAIGNNALTVNTIGARNTAVGSNTLAKNSLGGDNTALGYYTLANSDATGNTALGSEALTKSTGGDYNTAVGSFALQVSDGNTQNTAIGYAAGALLATGSNNTLIGYRAMSNLTSGTENVAIGVAAWIGASGNKNTVIGSRTGSNAGISGDNNILLGYGTQVPVAANSNQLNIGNTIFGLGMTGTVAAPAGNIGIGTSSPTTTLHVQNTASPAFRLVDGTQAAGKILTSDANGNTSWQTLSVTSIAGTLPSSPTSFSSYGTGTPPNINQYTGGFITLPPGKWLISVGSTVGVSNNSSNVVVSDGSLWCAAFFSDNTTTGSFSADIIQSYSGNQGNAGVIGRGCNKTYVTGYCAVNNTSGANKTYYLWAHQELDIYNVTGPLLLADGSNAYWKGPFGSGYWERYFFAIPIQ